MRAAFFLLLLFLAVAIVLRAQPARPATGEVHGCLVDESRRPLAGVKVVLADMRGGDCRDIYYSSDGFFSFCGIPPGDYLLTAEVSGLKPLQRHVQVGKSGRIIDLAQVILSPPPRYSRGVDMRTELLVNAPLPPLERKGTASADQIDRRSHNSLFEAVHGMGVPSFDGGMQYNRVTTVR